MRLPADLDVRDRGRRRDGIAALVGACDATYRAGRRRAGSRRRRAASWTAGAAASRTAPGGRASRWSRRPGGRAGVLHPGGDQRAAVGRADHRAAHIAAMFSHPDRWREGIASALLAAAERAMHATGYVEAQLWTPEQAPARRFYEAQDWAPDGRRQWLEDLSLPIVAYVKSL